MLHSSNAFSVLAARHLFAAVTMLSSMPLFAASPTYRLADSQRLEGNVRWDYLTYEPARHRLFITRGDHVDVFDAATKRVTGMIADTRGVHGVALAPELDQGYTSNGQDNTVTVFTLSTLRTTATIATGERPDAIVYDGASKRVFTANAKSEDLTAIDTGTDKAAGTTAVGGKPEFMAVDGKGKLFVNIESKNQLVVVDTHTLSVLHRFDVAACDEPAGLAIDRASEHLFMTCHNQKMVVVDGNDGKVIAALPIGRGSDAATFDEGAGLASVPMAMAPLTVVGRDGGHYAVKQNVSTMRGARTMALDPESHAIYLVSAQAAPSDPAKPAARPALIDGTFTLLTVLP
ncbi:MAG: hypothetical protein WDN04_16640 [Rhodospirillales bacterium]